MKSSITGQEKMTLKYRRLLNRGDRMGRFEYITLTTLMFVFTEMMNWRLLNTGQSTSILVILLPGHPVRNILKLIQDLQSYGLCMKSRIFIYFL